jgi:thiol-disulfide isomerase/thioredoxin
MQIDRRKNGPVFLHFFNPDCPCSRFNMLHFKSLVKEYGDEANFVIVVLNNKKYSEKEIQKKFGVALPVIFDESLATACGVYSTPQAVILDSGHHLYYRGNYNKSRYCTDAGTSYVKIAIRNLLNQRLEFAFDHYALTAYGCRLPTCTN